MEKALTLQDPRIIRAMTARGFKYIQDEGGALYLQGPNGERTLITKALKEIDRKTQEQGLANVDRYKTEQHKKMFFDLAITDDPKRLEKGFKTFMTQDTPKLEQIKKRLMILAMKSPTLPTDPPTKIMLQGGTGVGKTHLLTATLANINHYTHEEGQTKRVVYVDCNTLNRRLLNSFDKESKGATPDQLAQTLKKAHFLGLDDLGSETGSENTKRHIAEYLANFWYDIFNNYRGHLLVTTNLPPDKIRYLYGDRIYSRLFEGLDLITINAKDHRRGKHVQRY